MLRRISVFVLLLVTIGAWSPAHLGAQGSASLDLAALALRPADIGQPGWRHLGAFVQSLEATAADVAGYRGQGLSADDVAARLRDFGWQRQYVAVLALPSDADPATSTRIVRSYITEYSDETSAAAGFAYLEDESMVSGAEDVPLDQQLGAQAEATREQGSSSGRPFRSVDVTFQAGALVAGVTVVNYPSLSFDDPDLSEAEALAMILVNRLASPPAPGSTLGGAVLRLGGPDHTITTYDDAYYRWEGADVPLSGENPRDAAARAATYAGATDVYQVWQGIDAGTPAGALFGVTLLHFPDAAAATTWIVDLPSLLDENAFYGSLEQIDAPPLGDQSTALAYASGGQGAPNAKLIAVRVGTDVARVHLVPQGRTTGMPIEALEQLTRAQVDCLLGLACPMTTAVPDALENALSAPSPSATPQVRATPHS